VGPTRHPLPPLSVFDGGGDGSRAADANAGGAAREARPVEEGVEKEEGARCHAP
jgi:hypothetical protein